MSKRRRTTLGVAAMLLAAIVFILILVASRPPFDFIYQYQGKVVGVKQGAWRITSPRPKSILYSHYVVYFFNENPKTIEDAIVHEMRVKQMTSTSPTQAYVAERTRSTEPHWVEPSRSPNTCYVVVIWQPSWLYLRWTELNDWINPPAVPL